MVWNVVANLVGRFSTVLVSLFFIPVYIDLLGFSSYAIITFTLVIAGFMTILDGGITSTLTREVARSDISRLEKAITFRTLEFSYFAVVVIVIALIISSANLIAGGWLKSSNLPDYRIAEYLKIESFDIGFTLLLRFYAGGLFGLERQIKGNLLLSSWGLARSGGCAIAVYLIPNLDLFFLIQAIATISFAIIAKLIAERDIYAGLLSMHPKPQLSVLLRVKYFALGMFAGAIVASFNTQFDKLAISKLLDVHALAIYTLCVTIGMGIVTLVRCTSIAILPRLTAYFSGRQSALAVSLSRQYAAIAAGLAIPIFVNIAIHGHALLWAWTGHDSIASAASTYLPVIAWSFTMLSIGTIPYNIAIANGNTRINNILGATTLTLSLPGYWLVTKYYGLMGTALVFSTLQTFVTLIYLYIVNRKYIGESILSTYRRTLLLPLVVSVPLALLLNRLFTIGQSSRAYTLLWFAACTGICVVAVTLSAADSRQPLRRLAALYRRN